MTAGYTVYDICRMFISENLDLLGPDLSARLLGYNRSRSLKDLTSCSKVCFDMHQHSVEVFIVLRQIEAFFKKEASLESDAALSTAIDAFVLNERRCSITNRRLEYYYLRPHRQDKDLSKWLDIMANYIAKVLGEYDPFLESLPRRIKVTNGATLSSSRRHSLPHLKMRKVVECSQRAVPYVNALGTYFGYPIRATGIDLNRVEFVPKNWKTQRTIACEPAANMPLQLAFDGYAKSRLLKFGVDLMDQSKNQEYAYRASLLGHLATVDIEAASDTVAKNVVFTLFPKEWYTYLSDIRSPAYICPKTKQFMLYNKFSSMGNGSTFAIETLVFAAACKAVGAKCFSVYGDDIIVDRLKVPNLFRLLKYLGFRVNVDKTFVSGPFRESCGLDVYEGTITTPHFLRKWDDRRKTIIAHHINLLVSIGRAEGKLWEVAFKMATDHKIPFVPYSIDSTTGAHLDVPTCYRLGLFRWSRRYGDTSFISLLVEGRNMKRTYNKVRVFLPLQDPEYRMVREDRADDSRGLFLWFLEAFRIPDRKAPVQCSKVPYDSHKYETARVRWSPSTGMTPGHVFQWSDYVAAKAAT